MKKFLSHVLTLVILLTMVITPKSVLAADLPTDIGDKTIYDYNGLVSLLVEDKKVATVEQDSSGIITVTLKKDIIGRINFEIPNAHIIFDANGHTVDGGTTLEGICLENYSNCTVKLIGGGTYKKGLNYAIYVGVDNTLVIMYAEINIGEVSGEGDIKDQRNHEHTWPATLTKDDVGHWYACSDCYKKKDYLEHSDTDKNHICDSGCGKTDMGAHEDAVGDGNHLCDYGCGGTISTCADSDSDHDCDECGSAMGIHIDENKDHICDYGCSVTIGTCEDKDKDHTCDYGCRKEYGTHAQATGKHTCDYCGATMSDCSGGTATCTKKAICSVCGAEYGELLQHTYGTDWKSDKDNHWHECACGDRADTAVHTPKVVNAKETTTSEKGYTGDTVCEVCGYEIAKGEDIPVKATPNEPDNNNTTNDEPTSPQTGDKSNMFLWVALLFVSGVGLMGAAVFDKKSKVNR